jgi:hypothetical protein
MERDLVQRIETKLAVIKWMVGFNLVITLGILWRVMTLK